VVFWTSIMISGQWMERENLGSNMELIIVSSSTFHCIFLSFEIHFNALLFNLNFISVPCPSLNYYSRKEAYHWTKRQVCSTKLAGSNEYFKGNKITWKFSALLLQKVLQIFSTRLHHVSFRAVWKRSVC
jgi:uncharacterized membrane protein